MHVLNKAAFAAALSAVMPFGFAAFPATAAPTAEATVERGADYVSPPAIPEQFYVDARRLPAMPAWRPGDPIREIPRQFHGEEERQRHPPAAVNPVLPQADFLVELQREVRTPITGDAFTTPLVNRDGQGYSAVFPPDPSGDVGGGYYVQVINGSSALYTIYKTSDGSAATGQFKMSSLGSGGACGTGGGDGVVVFDQLAQRWLLTEFSNTGNNLCVYISAGDNPVATTWTRYAFVAPGFPDYPKYGVWSDAYYVGTNESSPALYALDRAKMLAGLPATMQRKTVPKLTNLGFQMLLPASLNGASAPPVGAPGIFARQNDDERTTPGSNDPNQDFIELFTYAVDWNTPANTTVTGPIRIGQAEFDSKFTVGSGFGAINQPDTTRKLDPLFEVMMYSFHYRNFGDHETLVGNHVTQIQTGNIAGIRWFELRRTGGTGGSWSLHQQGTYAPADADAQISRWMGASAMDQSGNIALAYAVARVNPKVYPGLRYTGRLAGAPLGVMTATESSLVEGGSSQTNADRWGDYFHMGVDPSDGCTFWFTGMHEPVGGKWSTRIASFRFDSCSSAQGSFTMTATNLDQRVCAASPTPVALQPVTLTIAPTNGFADPVTMSFAPPGLPAGFSGHFTVNPVMPPTTTAAELGVSNAAGAGARSVTLRGSAGSIERDVVLNVSVVTQVPGPVALTAPADQATGQPPQPLFQWVASQQVENYRIDIATDAAFADTILSQTLPGGATAFQPSASLPAGTRLYWRVGAINLCGNAAAGPVFTFTTEALPAPEIHLGADAIEASAVVGQSTTTTLAIGNTGSADLGWDASVVEQSCLTPSGLAWLSIAPDAGTIHAGDPDTQVSIGLDASQLEAGVHNANLCVHSNDTAHPLIVVPVTFTVTPDGDDTIFTNGFDGE